MALAALALLLLLELLELDELELDDDDEDRDAFTDLSPSSGWSWRGSFCASQMSSQALAAWAAQALLLFLALFFGVGVHCIAAERRRVGRGGVTGGPGVPRRRGGGVTVRGVFSAGLA